MAGNPIPDEPEDDEYPNYPYSAEECRESFVVKARSPEEAAFSLGHDLYSELAQIWQPTGPATHVEAATDILRLLAERVEMLRSTYLVDDAPGARSILDAARAADEAAQREAGTGKG